MTQHLSPIESDIAEVIASLHHLAEIQRAGSQRADVDRRKRFAAARLGLLLRLAAHREPELERCDIGRLG